MKTLHFSIAHRTRGRKVWRSGTAGSVRGRRARIASAGEHVRYITRAVADAGEHVGYVTRATHRTQEDLVATGHGNLPAWATNCPIHFFEQSATWERQGGRTATQITVALPRELTHTQQREAVEGFLQGQLGTQHAYVWGIHETTARDGGRYPHAHIAFCERTDSGRNLPPELYFSRQGYQKNRTFNDQGWAAAARQAWSDTLNVQLEHAGAISRVDARTFRAQGVEHEATARIRLDELKRDPRKLAEIVPVTDTPAMQATRAAAWEERKLVLGLTRGMTWDETVQRIGDASREAIALHQEYRRHLALSMGDTATVTQRLTDTQEKQERVRQLTQDEQRYVKHPEQSRTMQHLVALSQLFRDTEGDTLQRARRRRIVPGDESDQGRRRGYSVTE